jgi:hypothetical protein
LRKFFGISRAPNSNAGWRKIIILWRVKNLHYSARYPELPPLTAKLIEEVIDELPQIEKGVPLVDFSYLA